MSQDRKAFNGLALVIVKATHLGEAPSRSREHNLAGSIVVTAESDGLPAAKCTVKAK